MSEPWQLLRPGVLEGVRVLVAGPPAAPADSLGAAAAAACDALGARVVECRPGHGALELDEEAMDAAVEAALGDCGGAADVLVVDAAALFAGTGAASARDALALTLQGTWAFVRAGAAGPLLEAGGRVLLLAPRAGSGEHAGAAAAALENLARTLSVEWARHAVSAVAIAPGAATAAAEVGALVAYLASAAGSYFSGCVLDLRGGGRLPG
jgi:NAD(P)-dependent dehydrogenase (short-subunit alcohol dehydrogenase family)